MSFLAQIVAYVLQWALTLGGKALYEFVTDFVATQKEKAANKKNLEEYEKAKKGGNKDDILDKERDLINGAD